MPFAYKLYTKTGRSNEKLAKAYKYTFCRTVYIDFIGVWSVCYLVMSTLYQY